MRHVLHLLLLLLPFRLSFLIGPARLFSPQPENLPPEVQKAHNKKAVKISLSEKKRGSRRVALNSRFETHKTPLKNATKRATTPRSSQTNANFSNDPFLRAFCASRSASIRALRGCFLSKKGTEVQKKSNVFSFKQKKKSYKYLERYLGRNAAHICTIHKRRTRSFLSAQRFESIKYE